MSTISDSDRREVAAELRRQAAYSSGSLGEYWQRLQDVATGEVDFVKPSKTFRALADLIDRPTCRMEPNEDWSGEELYPTDAYTCSACGAVAVDGKPKFCPECGAEVIA